MLGHKVTRPPGPAGPRARHGTASGGGQRPRLTPARFSTGDVLTPLVAGVQEEVQIEGLLHVTAVQAGSCLERFGDLATLPAPSTSLPSLTSVLQSADAARSSSAREAILNEAICLATPPDNPGEQEPALRGAAAGSNSGAAGWAQRLRARWASDLDGLTRLEAATYQRAALAHGMYTSAELQASAAIRRQRRRALIRALRVGREKTQALLSSMGSCDADDADAGAGSAAAGPGDGDARRGFH